jgi:uncharacterized protein
VVAPLNSELFLIPDGDGYLVYAPLRKALMRVTADHVNLLARLAQGQTRDGDTETDFYQGLVKAGIIGGPPEVQPATFLGRSFNPVRVTLFLTTQCNLACKYCYAADGRPGLVMKEEIGRAALDYVAANSKLKGLTFLEVGFHGGGEPTMAWDELVALTSYAEELAAKHSLKLRVGLATNGCLDEAKARWIAAHFSTVNVSLDGPPRIQNLMRPRKGGGQSWPRIRRTLKIFDEGKTPYAFQATITRATVREMPAIVRFMARHTHPRTVKFEPVTNCGRFAGRGDEIPSPQDFAHYYNQAFELARSLKLQVSFSGIRLSGNPLTCFCGAFGEPFSVTPEGYVSACFETFCGTSAYADLYLFGRWDETRGTFRIEREKLERLRRRNVYELEPCSRCFCKYSCAGDCATRNFRHFGGDDLFRVGARCEVIRESTRQHLVQAVNSGIRNQAKVEEGARTNEKALCQ